jgi:hypothetical protein
MEPILGIKWALSLLSAAYAGRTLLARRRIFQPRELRTTPAARISDAVEGRVRLTGVVHARLPLVDALFSGTPCLAYEIVIESKMRHGPASIVRLIDGVSFSLDDGSGLAEIAIDDPVWLPDRCGPAGLSVVVPPHESVVVRTGGAKDARITRLLVTQGLGETGATRLRITEAIVKSEDVVTIVGSGFPCHAALVTTTPRSGYVVRANTRTLLIGPGYLRSPP